MVLEIVTPDSKVFDGEIVSITLPGIEGSFQILNKAAYNSIKNRVDYLKNSSSNLTEKIKIQIINLLIDEDIICEVVGREKRTSRLRTQHEIVVLG